MATGVRRSLRRKTSIAVNVLLRNGRCHPGVIIDISVGGCSLVTRFDILSPSEECSILIDLSDKPYELYARVLHKHFSKKGVKYGLGFLLGAGDAYRALVRFIYDDATTRAMIMYKIKSKNR